MTNEELNRALYDKMSAEMENYRNRLMAQSPEDILRNAYEYAVREDIVLSLEYNDLNDAQAQALLDSENPLQDVFDAFEKMETGYMDSIQNCVENVANEAVHAKKETELRKTEIYIYPAVYAREHGELEQYRASRKVNIACKNAIEDTIKNHYDGAHIAPEAVREVAGKFGYERMFYVLANTVRMKEWDGRFSEKTKLWAHTITVIEDESQTGENRNSAFAVQTHPAILNGFIDMARHEYLLSLPLSLKEISSEAQRIMDGLQAVTEPNSPHKTHFMVEISPDFLRRATDKNMDTLICLLPFRTLSVTPLKERKGTFAMISKNEDRASKTALKNPEKRKNKKPQAR